MTDFGQDRMCPYCGEWILLADCFVVATHPNDVLRGPAPVDERLVAPSQSLDDADAIEQMIRGMGPVAGDPIFDGTPVVSAVDPTVPFAADELRDDAALISDQSETTAPWSPTETRVPTDGSSTAGPPVDVPPRVSPPVAPDWPQPAPPAGRPRVRIGSMITSQVDGLSRRVVAMPPVRPVPPADWSDRKKRKFKPTLPSVIDQTVDQGGPRLTPRRCCPRPTCQHPLPLEIDHRSVFVVALSGNSRASKSTLLAALAVVGRSVGGPASLGLREFRVAPESTDRLETIVGHYLRNTPMPPTPPEEDRPPVFFEIVHRRGARILLVFHDIAGEVYSDPARLDSKASHLYWSDAAIFVVNPEQTPGFRGDAQGTDEDGLKGQDGALAGLTAAMRSRPQQVPQHLALVLGKGDLAQGKGVIDLVVRQDGDVEEALRDLRAEAVVNEAETWPRRSWHVVAPLPKNDTYGVADLFRKVFDEMVR